MKGQGRPAHARAYLNDRLRTVMTCCVEEKLVFILRA